MNRNSRVLPIAVFVLPTTSLYNPGRRVSLNGEDTGQTSASTSIDAATYQGRTGRPPVHSETWSKVSVVLFDRQIHHLDRLATDIRGKTGKVLNRAEIIRALIDGLIDSGMDITVDSVGGRPARPGRAPPRLSVPLSALHSTYSANSFHTFF